MEIMNKASIHCFGAAVLMGLLAGCGQFAKKSERERKSEADARFETAQYAGIVIFEGGSGKRPLFKTPDEYTPIWRWTVCLDRSGKDRNGKIDVDMAKLSAPYTWTVTVDGRSHEERQDQVTIKYSYRAELVKSGHGDDAMVAEQLVFNSESLAGDDEHDIVVGKLFEIEWDRQSVSTGQVAEYKFEGSPYYLFSKLEPYRYSRYEDTQKAIEICGDHGTEPFLLLDDEIPRD
jgi:hypothetical protein